MGAGLAGGASLSTTQSGHYGCWVSWGTSLSTTQSGPYENGLAGRPPCLPHSQVIMDAGLGGSLPHQLLMGAGLALTTGTRVLKPSNHANNPVEP